MAKRLCLWSVAFLLVLLLVGCGESGRYALAEASVNGEAFTEKEMESVYVEIDLRRDGSFSRLDADGKILVSGTWEKDGSKVVLRDAEGENELELVRSGKTMTLEEDGFVFVFRKK